jgi:hypothetical protein
MASNIFWCGSVETPIWNVKFHWAFRLKFIFQQGSQEHHELTGERNRGVRLRVTPAANYIQARVLTALGCTVAW